MVKGTIRVNATVSEGMDAVSTVALSQRVGAVAVAVAVPGGRYP